MIINTLIVDDEPDAIDMLTAMVQYTSFKLEFQACFTDPREALKYEQWECDRLAISGCTNAFYFWYRSLATAGSH